MKPPLNPDVAVHSDTESVEESLGKKIWRELERQGLILASETLTSESRIAKNKTE